MSPPPAQCTMNASRMMARMTTTNQKKNTTIPGMAYPATLLALATASSYPAPPGLSATGVWYWEFDRGGPVARANAVRMYPDFQFVQMASPQLAPPDWEPAFGDYLYLSFTNATAFSPTDTMPLSLWAKMGMTAQATVSIVTVALIVARAVNILR
jgi:hypothetical protein